MTNLVSNLLEFFPLGSRIVKVVSLQHGQLFVGYQRSHPDLPLVGAAVRVQVNSAAAAVVVTVVAHEALFKRLIGLVVVVVVLSVAVLVVPE